MSVRTFATTLLAWKPLANRKFPSGQCCPSFPAVPVPFGGMILRSHRHAAAFLPVRRHPFHIGHAAIPNRIPAILR